MDPTNAPHSTPALLSDQFPILQNGLYFNHAAVGPWPRCTAEAVQSFAEENMLQGSAGYREWYARENQLRLCMAELTGAGSAGDIALLKNTTEGICAVAFGLHWKEGENIVIPAGEFPSNRLPWLAQAAHGVEIREVDIRTPACAETALSEAMDQNTRLLAVSAVQWSDGFRLDLERLGNICAGTNTLFFVDAIQQLGALPMDVEACRIDFLAADAHKWLLAPEGIAVFYCRESVRPELELLQQGWHMFDHPWLFERNNWTPASSAKRFEAGSPNTLGQAALHATAELLLNFGMENVGRRVLDNSSFLFEELGRFPGARIRSAGGQPRRSGIVSFTHETIAVTVLHQRLTDAGVSAVVREDAIRLSPHFYQGESQLLDFMSILQAATA